jgi:hypothetical protein
MKKMNKSVISFITKRMKMNRFDLLKVKMAQKKETSKRKLKNLKKKVAIIMKIVKK